MDLGMGVMLHILGGGSEIDSKELVGKTVIDSYFDEENNKVFIVFEDFKISIWDNGQSCCENRYITMDDNPKDLIGGELLSIETKSVGDIQDDYETHEQVFVEIKTTKGYITFCNHNEHNGYYGGFGLTITKE